MRSYRYSVILLFLCLLLSSCAQLAPKLIDKPVSPEFADGLMQDWVASVAMNHSLQGMAKFEMTSPDRSLKGSQVLLVEKPDRLRAEVLSLFGSPLLLLTADGEKLDVLLPFENDFYTGKPSAKNLGRFVRLPLRLEDLISVLLYQPPILTAERKDAYALKGGGWLIESRNPPHRQRLFFDQERRLVEASYYDQDGLILKVTYGKFSAEGQYPALFNVELPRQDTGVSLEFSDLELNREMAPDLFELTVPENARVYLLDEEN